jgi:glycogen synthase
LSQVIKKRRIVLASLLKPVDDTRMLEKIGATLAHEEGLEVFIIGYPTTANIKPENITLMPLKPFGRASVNRLKASLEVLKKIHEVKPELIIINTPELLWVAILNRILFGRKIIYDVLENYYRNIRYTEVYPKWIRLPLALLTRLAERLSAPFLHQFFLAEKGYETELRFAKPRLTLENKFPEEIARKFYNNAPVTHLIFTGTIAPTTGVIEAISLCKGLHAVDQNYSLTIVGYCADPSFLNELKTRISGKDFIKLIGGDHLIVHSEILSEISKAGTGIVIYKINPSTICSISTKLYEYLALGKTVLIRHNDESHKLVERLNAGIILSDNVDFKDVDRQLKSSEQQQKTDASLYWESQAAALSGCIKNH